MSLDDEAAQANRRLWEREVSRGCGYTVPWLDLDVSLLRAFAEGDVHTLPEPLDCMSPPGVLAGVAGKDVLCLASGGGQQSAVFGLLGARVTVLDLAEGQLKGDERAAAHYGYEVTLVQADMRDLSDLPAGSFDVVYQEESLSYVPDVRQVYRQVARVLRAGGTYRIAHHQPAIDFLTWDGEAYRIALPYASRIKRREDGGIEFRHYMDDLFGGLIDAGLSPRQILDDSRHKSPDPQAGPGTWEHEASFVGGRFVVVAVKNQHSRRNRLQQGPASRSR